MILLSLASLCALIYLLKLGAEYIREHGNRKKKPEFTVGGLGISEDQLSIIELTLRRLYYPMRKRKVRFRIYSHGASHLAKAWNDTPASGHLCNIQEDRICLSSSFVDFMTICHEMGHLHHAYLNRGQSDFDEAWKEVAGDVYRKDITLPNNEGILTGYSRGNAMEDVAEWVAECYCYLCDGVNTGITNNAEVKMDPRYRKKLVLLRDYGFLSKEDYAKLKPLFE